MERWKETSSAAERSIAAAGDLDALEKERVAWLGRSGKLNLLMKELPALPEDRRRAWGGPANQDKNRIVGLLEERKESFERAALEGALTKAEIDPTLPPPPPSRGRLHPLTLALDEMISILARLGFSWAEGPNAETEYYNFEALNIPAEHPARDTQDTFFLKTREGSPGLLMRTHTSPVQIRRMESARPPIRIIAPGRVFRHEAVDASHSAVFHQIEGLYVDKNVSMADLKGTLDTFLQCLFGSQTKTRFRPSNFPFTEPSAEVDISCILCGGSGCAACKRSGWMEILGCGLVHPNVFKAVDYNPELWSGFAFGLGVERIAMLKLGVTDIRMFYENDVRFLEQWG
ncbi:MAG: phenylalanine--tRNA ligase subunit alpha [Elusimicrobia bacterium]|nr:phenylalanine--tRNA ligase subunit alpha [Elusimicrobiota bacterium]